MEMHQVKYFLAAARTLNFTRAAEESNVTQPSLTRAIQKLEEEFGGLLFRRERSLTHLTELGRMLVPHLDRTYEAAQAAKMLAKGVGRAESAPLAFGVAGNISAHLSEALAEVSDALPGFQLSLVRGNTEHLIDDMLKGDLDAAILVAPRELPERLDSIELAREDYAVISRKDGPLATKGRTDLSDLDGLSWIEGDSDVAIEFRNHCVIGGVEPDFRHVGGSDDSAKDLVAAGMGCAIVPAGQALPDRVVEVSVEGMAISRATIFATISGRQRSTATDAMIRAVKARNWMK